MTHGGMLNKDNSNLVALFNISQCVIAQQFGDFVPRKRLAAKGPPRSFHLIKWVQCSGQ